MSDPLKTKLSNFDKLKLKKISKSESKHIRRLKETARNESIPEPIKKKQDKLNHSKSEERYMKNEVGLWVDHRKAVIVTIENQKETVQIILSTMEKHTRFSSGAHSDTPNDVNGSSAEDIRDRQFDLHLSKYYSEIAYNIRAADSIMIFGPGEAKVEFASHLKHEKLGGKIAQVDAVDKMTDRQIVAKVHDYFIHA